MTIVYVSTGAWGAGTGTPNSAAQVDGNFYDLVQQIVTLNDDLAIGKRIDSVSNSPNSITFNFTDATTQVIPLPIATLNYRGLWANSTPYTRDNLVLVPGVGVYQVLVDHTTPALPATFNPDAVSDDTDADPLYSSFLPLFDHFPLGGTTGQIIVKLSDGDDDTAWASLNADIVLFAASTASALTSTNVADALEELKVLIDDVSATDVSFTPSTGSTLTSTNVADALEELSERGAGDAAGISFTPSTSSDLASANVADALEELDAALAGKLVAANNLSDLANAATARTNLGVATSAIAFVIDGGGSVLTTGLKGYLEIPFACTITRATLLADVSGSVVVDIFKCSYSNFDASSTHPVSGDKITASAPPTISSATKSQDATLTGWTTALSAGDILAFDVNSATTIQRVTVSLEITR